MANLGVLMWFCTRQQTRNSTWRIGLHRAKRFLGSSWTDPLWENSHADSLLEQLWKYCKKTDHFLRVGRDWVSVLC